MIRVVTATLATCVAFVGLIACGSSDGTSNSNSHVSRTQPDTQSSRASAQPSVVRMCPSISYVNRPDGFVRVDKYQETDVNVWSFSSSSYDAKGRRTGSGVSSGITPATRQTGDILLEWHACG